MEIVTFVLFGVLALGMGAVSTIFHKKTGWQGIVVKGLTMLVLLSLALVSANLKELTNALSLFITLALAFLILSEVVTASNEVDEKSKLIVYSVFSAVSTILFAVGAVSLSEFNVLALIGGILAGLGIGLIVCAIKKNWALYPILMEILVWLSIGLLLGFALTAVLTSQHLISSVLMLVGSVLMVLQRLLQKFGGEKVAIGYVINGVYVVALLLMTMTIYFY